jgi:SagB-type dehydrogenase family enzyme
MNHKALPALKRTIDTKKLEEINRNLLLMLLRNCSTNGQKLSDLFKATPQGNGLPQPPVQLEYDTTKHIHILPKPQDIKVNRVDLRYAIENRRSIRSYSEEPLKLEELAWLLWATQGVRDIQATENRIRVMRNVPSGGSLHPFETYLIVNKVEGLKPGLYRYLAISHELLGLQEADNLHETISEYCGFQPWIKNGAVTFLWSFVPYRSVWRYSWGAYKLFMEAGHICQNLYLAAEAVRCGVCAIGAFDLHRTHELLGIDDEDEILVYVASVGKRK